MTKQTRRKAVRKPKKPRASFPLFAHASGQWAKKVRGRLVYFGVWSDPDAALQKYLAEKDDLHAGRVPRVRWDGLTVRDLLNRFLTAKRDLVDTGEIMPRTFNDYYITTSHIIGAFGKNRLVDDLATDDFQHLRSSLAKTRGPVALGNEIQRVRMVFKYALDCGLIDRPIRYGSTFNRPSKRVLRKARNANGPRMFEADEIRTMIQTAGVQLRAMILLGINCGFGNADCANLPQKAVDLQGGWVNYPRPKTGVQRRCPLWPETVGAVKKALTAQFKAKNKVDVGLVFITNAGGRWGNDKIADSVISKETAKLLKKLGIHHRGRNFYGLRRSFETIGGDSRDQVAVDHIMGHAPDSRDMSAVYRERIGDDRLRAVVEHVREWLFGDDTQE